MTESSFRHLSTHREDRHVQCTFEYVDRAGKSQRFVETIYDQEGEESLLVYQAALQLQARLEEQLRALAEFSGQYSSLRYPT